MDRFDGGEEEAGQGESAPGPGPAGVFGEFGEAADGGRCRDWSSLIRVAHSSWRLMAFWRPVSDGSSVSMSIVASHSVAFWSSAARSGRCDRGETSKSKAMTTERAVRSGSAGSGAEEMGNAAGSAGSQTAIAVQIAGRGDGSAAGVEFARRDHGRQTEQRDTGQDRVVDCDAVDHPQGSGCGLGGRESAGRRGFRWVEEQARHGWGCRRRGAVEDGDVGCSRRAGRCSR